MSSSGSGFNSNDNIMALERKDPGLAAPNQTNPTPKIVKRVQVLRELEGQHKELEKQLNEEKAELVEKYHELRKTLYQKRYEIVNGITEVIGVKPDEASEEKGVPNFWLSALKNSKEFLIMKHDKLALEYLKDIKWDRIHDPQGFKLEFLFDPNPYFKNSVLTKTYHMIEKPDERIHMKEIGTDIEWYPGKNLFSIPIPRQNSKNAKSTTGPKYCYSFFKHFQPPQYEDYCTSRDRVCLFKRRIHYDREIGLTIRDKIIPHAVSWFTGEAVELDSDYETDDDDSDESYAFFSDDDDDCDKSYAFSSDDEEDIIYQVENGKRKQMSGWTDPEIAMAGPIICKLN